MIKIYKNSDCFRCIDKFVGCGKTALQVKMHPVLKKEVLLCIPCYSVLQYEVKGEK